MSVCLSRFLNGGYHAAKNKNFKTILIKHTVDWQTNIYDKKLSTKSWVLSYVLILHLLQGMLCWLTTIIEHQLLKDIKKSHCIVNKSSQEKVKTCM